jgi:hypothetical protein
MVYLHAVEYDLATHVTSKDRRRRVLAPSWPIPSTNLADPRANATRSSAATLALLVR